MIITCNCPVPPLRWFPMKRKKYVSHISGKNDPAEETARIAWMLKEKHAGRTDYVPEYGDLSDLNEHGIIKTLAGQETLRDIASEYLDLLESSTAVYERNGDYALGLFTSGWCRMLDAASRKLCGTSDNTEAMKSGKWLCHESCWNDAALKSMKQDKPADIACSGGIRMYAVPVKAGEEIVGAVNFGYGDPPRDDETLKKLSRMYQLPIDQLREKAEAYPSRPPFIIDLAKRRIQKSADLLGHIIESRQAEQQTAKSHKLLQYIIEHTNSAVAVHDRNLRYLYVSQQYLQQYNVEEKHIIGRHHYDVFPDLPQKWRDAHQLALKGEVIRADRDPYCREDGSTVWTRWECRPWYEPDGTIGGIIVYTEVINKQVEAEEERLNLQEQLHQAQKMEAVGRLAGGVAHDFNNMLSVIQGYAEMLKDDMKAADAQQTYVSEILNAAERSREIAQQLLAYARKQKVSPVSLDLNKYIEETMLSMMKRLIGEHITLQWQPASHLMQVHIDTSQLNQIIMNLCVNARDAVDSSHILSNDGASAPSAGGEISIETGMSSFDKAYCAARPEFQPGRYVRLTVRDNGCGIRREDREKLFEPFFTTKKSGKGTGLGLSTVYGIVRQNSGFICVESRLGEGAAFSVFLPAETGQNEQETSVSSEKKVPECRKETVLVVEDELSILKLTKTMLEQIGCTVLTAEGPEEAVRIAETAADRIDLLITDVVMSEMNGRDLYLQIARIRPEIPVLYMSGYPVAENGGKEIFIQKPFSLKELSEKIRSVLNCSE